MRTENEMFDLIIGVARADERIRAVYYYGLYHDDLIQGLGDLRDEYYAINTLMQEKMAYSGIGDIFDSPCPRVYLALSLTLWVPVEHRLPIKKVNSIPDFDWELLRQLYNSGIITGVGTDAYFSGFSNITRSQLAAIIARVLVPALRVK